MLDEIVISGVSGRFPESSNMKEFQDNLLGNVNMVTVNERRFKAGVYGIPKGFGALKEIDKFDAEFFGVHPKQAAKMDPQLRMSLETTAEAMLDAGVNPGGERGSSTGVFVGICSSEAHYMWTSQASKTEGFAMTGCAKAMFANRISYAFDFNGPSCAYDTACSSSAFALKAAVSSMMAGECSAAIVTGANLILNPLTTMQFNQLGLLSADSNCKAFDATGNGYVRAEAVATIYLQKRSDAKRVYASILSVKTNTDGFKANGITSPSASLQEELLEKVYEEAGVDMAHVNYIEAHGTGTQAGDQQEFVAIEGAFGRTLKNRTAPLLIGGLKSNMGHPEGASGVCAIAKILIMLQEGIIPANLHYSSPRDKMKAARNGNIQVVEKNMVWNGGLVGLNSFGFGGVNTHVILKPHDVHQRDVVELPHSLPKLITLSGRTEEGVLEALLNIELESNRNVWNLVNEAHKSPMRANPIRGFCIPGHKVTHVKDTSQATGTHSNVWFVFNGMGSQWDGMGRDLLKFPVFADSIRKSAETLESKFGYDLMTALLNPELSDAGSALHCFVTVAAIQIGIIDVLTYLGVKPHGLIGHSAGEMLCAYADECLTAEQTLACAYERGRSLASGGDGGMAVVGATWEDVTKTCPTGLYAACHNGVNSVTVAGPKSLLGTYMADMQEKSVFSKEVNSCGHAFHSPYIEDSSKMFLANLCEVIKEPKSRSLKWISTSVPKEKWNQELALKASPEYFANNFLSPVLFYEALQEIPTNATVIEIGPSGLLKGLIRKATSQFTNVIAMQSRDSQDSLTDFVTSLGHMFLAKVDMDVTGLYNKPVFPVPLGTPMISPFVAWDHTKVWAVPKYGENGEFLEGAFEIDISKETDRYLTGHQIQGRILFPATGYLVLVWKHFAQMHQTPFEEFPVVFENVKFRRVTVLRESGKVEFRLNISDLSGNFEIKESEAVVASGKIRRMLKDVNEVTMTEEDLLRLMQKEVTELSEGKREFDLLMPEIYKQFRFIGYEYGGLFKGINKRHSNGKYHMVNWNKNWVPFLDTVMQTMIGLFGITQTKTELPTEIAKLSIAPRTLLEFIENNRWRLEDVFVFLDRTTNIIRCPGIEFKGWKATGVQGTQREPPPSLATYSFRPFHENEAEFDEQVLCPILQCMSVIMENMRTRELGKTLEVVEFSETPETEEALKTNSFMCIDFAAPDVNYNVVTTEEVKQTLSDKYTRAGVGLQVVESASDSAAIKQDLYDIVILDNFLFVGVALDLIPPDAFLIFKFPLHTVTSEEVVAKHGDKLVLICHKVSPTQDIFLARKVLRKCASCEDDTAQDTRKVEDIKVVNISSQSLDWVEELRDIVAAQENMETWEERPKIFLISNGAEVEDSGILGLTLCLRKEPFCQQIRAMFSKNRIQLDFQNPSSLLTQILDQNLAISVIDSQGRLGSYFLSVIPTKAEKECDNAFIGQAVVGDLSTIHWIEGFSYQTLAIDSDIFIPVQVHAAALNFRDIMLASGGLQPEKRNLPYTIESPLGLEFAGLTEDGAMVAGFNDGQSLSTNLLANKDWMWNVPKWWSFEDAATFPVAYSTAYLALHMRGQIQSGESILIHAGAGGVGQAAIRLALDLDCTVFTTVGSKEKIDFIRETFPQVHPENIGYSRDTSFEKLVLERTDGRGVDLVLNSLAGDKLEASARCLARHGRFLEIGKVDLASNKAFGMYFFLRDACYHGVMLDSLWDAPPSVRNQLKDLVQDGLDRGVVQPLPYRSFSCEHVEPAFRFMGSGKHIGKVLVSFDQSKPILASRHVYFDPAKSYIVCGGLGGIGLEFVNWMISRYARKLVLTSRSGITNGYQATYIDIWQKNGITVEVLELDAADPEKAELLLNTAQKLGPLGGFFNLAVQLSIGLMKSQSSASFARVMSPKYNLTCNMDKLTRVNCPQLDHFVVFSSVCASLGFHGQSNYGLANSAIERVVEKRVEDGLPGKAIQLGPVGEVGAWHDGYNADFARNAFHGLGVQSIASVLKAMDTLLPHPAPVMLSRRLIDPEKAGAKLLRGSMSVTERIAHILGHSTKQTLNPNVKLTELGMDSVMAMEVKQILDHEFHLTLTAVEIRTCTIKELEEKATNATTNKLVTMTKPTRRGPTESMFQLNFIRDRQLFFHDHCVYPINDLARGLDPNDKNHGLTVFIVNSVEGAEVLYDLGGYIKYPSYSMQMTKDAVVQSVEQIGRDYLKELKKTVPDGPYIIVGNCAGAIVAIEMAISLQEMGEIEKLILIDMTPGRLKAILKENFDEKSEDELDEETLLLLFTQIFGMDREQMESYLKTQKNPGKQVQLITEIVSGMADTRSLQEENLPQKIKIIVRLLKIYKPYQKYNGKISLIRTAQNLIEYDSCEFWGLEEFCTQTPKVHMVNTTHTRILTEPTVQKVADSVNND